MFSPFLGNPWSRATPVALSSIMPRPKQQMRKSKAERNQPPAHLASFVGSKTIRFYAANGGAYGLQINDLLDLICVATTSTQAYRLFDSVRLRSIEIWGAASTASNTLVSIEEINSGGAAYLASRSQVLQDMVVGTARAAHILYRPTPGTVQYSWFTATVNSSSQILNITAPAGAVLDLTIEYTMADGNQGPSAIASNSSFTTATAGNVYCRALCIATSSTNWLPAGLANK